MKEYIKKTISYIEDSSDTNEELYRIILTEIERFDTDKINKAFICGKIADKLVKTEKKNLAIELFKTAINFIEQIETMNDPWIELNKGILNEKIENFSTAKSIYQKCLQIKLVEKELFFKTLLKAVIERVNAKMGIQENSFLSGVAHYKKSSILFRELAELEKNEEMKKKWKNGEIEMNKLAQKYLRENHS